MSSVRRAPCSRDWLRVLVLLLALLVSGAHVQAHPMPPVPAGELVEYDVLDTALRPPARTVHRMAVPPRPAPRLAPRPETDPGLPAGRRPALSASPRPPKALPALRSVVLRC
ncbi:hypothetical protein [Streptomyces sp. SLBN-8D4]|uniref:hypothetical protein n=1 Tax=Streptomyces sp. SLBN-8D4 TaxID=3377728 RepID=UPI003C7D0768